MILKGFIPSLPMSHTKQQNCHFCVPFLGTCNYNLKSCVNQDFRKVFFFRAAVTDWLLKSLPRIYRDMFKLEYVFNGDPFGTPTRKRKANALSSKFHFFSSHRRSTNQRPDSGKAGVILERESMWQWIWIDDGYWHDCGIIMGICFFSQEWHWLACHCLSWFVACRSWNESGDIAAQNP